MKKLSKVQQNKLDKCDFEIEGQGKERILCISHTEMKAYDKKDFYKLHLVPCRIKKKCTDTQINCCRKRYLEQLKELDIDKIILFGSEAVKFLYGDRIKTGRIDKWVGQKIPDQKLNVWVYPNYHPVYVHSQKNTKYIDIYNQVIDDIVDHNEQFPKCSNLEKKIKILDEQESIAWLIKENKKEKAIYITDIETSGLKPHGKGHFIKSISFTAMNGKTNVFLVTEKNTCHLYCFLKKHKFIAHNIAFEYKWIYYILNVRIDIFWDTMIGVHALDSRSENKGLKIQTLFNFGIAGYDNKVEKYLKSKQKGANSFNTINDCPTHELLLYNGFDTYFTWLLYKKQNSLLKNHEGFDLFMEGVKAICEVESNGIRMDIVQCRKNDKVLQKKLNILNKKIYNSAEVKEWHKNRDNKFSFTSTKDLPDLLFNILKLKSKKQTPTGKPSVDEEALGYIDSEFTQNILKWKKIDKIKNNYLANFIRESVELNNNYFMFPSFNLHTVTTYRSSSSNPNFQNIPNHNDFAQRMTRGTIIPRKGNRLLEVDYSGIEVCISACYNQDPKLIEYITNPETDMHRDVAADLYKMDQSEIYKGIRYFAKNGFVFPQFYGSWYKPCAEDIWGNILQTPDLFEHMKKVGLGNYSKFESHVQKVEDIFWNERFVAYRDWKNKVYNDYLKKGYVKTKTGFMCKGVFKRNEILNYPIQGSAFHCLLWSFITLQKFLKENSLKTKIIGQIHDSIIFDIVPEEKEEIKKQIRYIMTEKIKEYWPWIIVPLDIEAEITEIDGNWYKKKSENI